MIPGPSDASPEALAEMAKPVMPHYGTAYLEIHERVLDRLAKAFGTRGTILMVPGPGTAGTEMSVCGLAWGKTLVVEAGAFSHRITEILESYGGEVVPLDVPFRRAVDPGDVRKKVESTPGLTAIALVQNESSTGIIHPLAEIGAIAREHDLLYIVDTVSGLAGADVSMDANHIDIAWSASQKALSAPAGLAFVAVNDRAFERLEAHRDEIKGWMLNPLTWKRFIENWAWHPYPTSLPTGVVRGLDVALDKVFEEGLENRYVRHARASRAVCAGASALGFEPFAQDDSYASPTVTSLIPPDAADEEQLRNDVLVDSGIWIAGGFGPLRGRIIRIGHMGVGATREAVLATILALENALIKQGLSIEKGAATAAAETELA